MPDRMPKRHDAKTLNLFNRPPTPVSSKIVHQGVSAPLERKSGEPERIATIFDVKEYFDKELGMVGIPSDHYYKAARGEDPVFSLLTEAVLMDKKTAAANNEIDKLRGLIRANSWDAYGLQSVIELELAAHRLKNSVLERLTQTQKKELKACYKRLKEFQKQHRDSLRGGSTDDAKDIAKEMEGLEQTTANLNRQIASAPQHPDTEAAQEICDALASQDHVHPDRPPRVGSDAESALRAIEKFYDQAWNSLRTELKKFSLHWEDLEPLLKYTGRRFDLSEKGVPPDAQNAMRETLEQIQYLRPLRNQIYHQYLYPNWFSEK